MENEKFVENQVQLLDLLKKLIDNTDRSQVSIILGHFPIIRERQKDRWMFREGWKTWGDFSLYTFELGCILGEYAKNRGKTVSLYIIADDKPASIKEFSQFQFTSQEAVPPIYRQEISRQSRRKPINRLFSNRSGNEAKLPPELEAILDLHDLRYENVAHHDHGKEGREKCLYFSENILDRDTKLPTDDGCARSYSELLLNHMDINHTCIISFIPTRCRDNICRVSLDMIFAVYQTEKSLHAAHVFMPANKDTTVENIWHSRPYLRLDMRDENEKDEF